MKELGEFSDGLINALFEEVDVDGNGSVDQDEFAAMIRNYLTDDDIQ